MANNSYLPAPHPAFAAHFTDPIYLDAANDLAPFPIAETLYIVEEWLERGIPATSTLHEMLVQTFEDDDEGIPFDEWDEDNENVDMATVALGFLLLRVNGRLEEEGLTRVYAAMDREQRRYGGGFAALTKARTDLESFAQ